MNENQCKATVYPSGTWGSFHPYRCSKKIWAEKMLNYKIEPYLKTISLLENYGFSEVAEFFKNKIEEIKTKKD
jgi:hypothetical protein